MRLVTKTTLYFLGAMIALVSITGIYLFRHFNRQINEKNDKELIAEEIAWIQYIAAEADNGNTLIFKSPGLSIYPVDQAPESLPNLSDTRDYSPQLRNKPLLRELSQVVSVSGISYKIIIKKSQEQKDALIANFTRVILFVLAGLFLATIIFIQVINRRLWAPFNQSLQKIRNVKLEQMKSIHFEKTNTLEFNQLNSSLNFMTRKIYDDYLNMKEFTEDAAHEMQTPIAVVQSKLELLLQDSELKDEQAAAVYQSVNALNRLAKLNQGLLLLARIENNQYQSDQAVSLSALVEKYLALFSEMIKDKGLQLTCDLGKDFCLNLHPVLADSLVTNLLGNAIKYNFSGGRIAIVTTANSLTIVNTSHHHAIDPDKVFKRFNSSGEAGEGSNGLGLAIVKKIAETAGLQISYHYWEGKHEFVMIKKDAV